VSKDPKHPKLTPKFDPIWRFDFGDLHTISPTAFIIRQLLRLTRDLETNLTDLSDAQIEKETGITRKTIRRARRELIQAGNIIPKGYHTYLIPPFKWVENTQPVDNNLGRNDPSLGSKVPNHLGRNDPSLGSKVPNSIITETEATETEGPPVPVYVSDDEIPHIRTLYSWADRHSLKAQLLHRHLSESDIGKVFERVYPNQYTGKAGKV